MDSLACCSVKLPRLQWRGIELATRHVAILII